MEEKEARFRLYRVRLNKSGYDDFGTYWGVGAPLYYYECDALSDAYDFIRASDRDDAKAKVVKAMRTQYPDVDVSFFK